ncbi:Uncharacterised protein [Mycobacteroides abscessus subsp. abscessus]|nr:Uncharacterised protein [Mycobacteroides abscessus subsp. abscessus]
MSASSVSTRPSTAGEAASTARERARPGKTLPCKLINTSARGPSCSEAIISAGSAIGYLDAPTEAKCVSPASSGP